jgi:hypothetical protein
MMRRHHLLAAKYLVILLLEFDSMKQDWNVTSADTIAFAIMTSVTHFHFQRRYNGSLGVESFWLTVVPLRIE